MNWFLIHLHNFYFLSFHAVICSWSSRLLCVFVCWCLDAAEYDDRSSERPKFMCNKRTLPSQFHESGGRNQLFSGKQYTSIFLFPLWNRIWKTIQLIVLLLEVINGNWCRYARSCLLLLCFALYRLPIGLWIWIVITECIIDKLFVNKSWTKRFIAFGWIYWYGHRTCCVTSWTHTIRLNVPSHH